MHGVKDVAKCPLTFLVHFEFRCSAAVNEFNALAGATLDTS